MKGRRFMSRFSRMRKKSAVVFSLSATLRRRASKCRRKNGSFDVFMKLFGSIMLLLGLTGFSGLSTNLAAEETTDETVYESPKGGYHIQSNPRSEEHTSELQSR